MSALPERFWSKVCVAGPDECWEWQAARMPSGYGKFGLDGRCHLSHRLAYEDKYGESPDVVRHSCDNPPCVNPAHLLGGTHQDNTNDAIARGRLVMPPVKTGSENAAAVLDFEKAEEIRASHAHGAFAYELAEQFGVHKNTIYNVLSDKTWRSS